MPATKGTNGRRGAARREQILDVATELFAAHGYRGTGLLEIAERVGMSHVGILHHFGTKEDLLRAVMARRDEIQARAVGEVQSTGIGELTFLKNAHSLIGPALLTRLTTVVRAENLDPGDPLHNYFDERQQQRRDILAAEIRAGQERGEIRSDIDPDLKAVEIMAFSIGLETQWLLNPELIDPDKTFASYGRALLDDLTRPDAPRRRPKNTRRVSTPPLRKATTA